MSGWTPDKEILGYLADADFTAAYSLMCTQATLGAPEVIEVAASTLVGRGAAGGITDLSVSDVRTLLGVTLDEAYNTSAGAASVTVDAGDVTWALTGAYSFVVDLTAATGATTDGFMVENGADYFRVRRAGTDDINVDISAKGFDIDTTGTLSLNAINIDASSNVTGMGTLGCGAITSSGTLALAANSIAMTGSIATTGARVTKGWFTDLECTNAIAGSITGNAATVTVAAEAADTTCSLGFFTAASGSLAPKTHTGLLFDAANCRVQIGGTTAPSDTLNTMAAASGGVAVVGPTELLLNGTFDTDLSSWTAGANWAWGAGGTADHTAGSTATLTQAVATTSGQHYQVTVVLSAVSASNVVMTLTSSSGSESFTLSSAASYTYSFKAGAASSTLTFTPNTAFVGSITSVSMKLITPASVYALSTMDSGGARSGLASVATDDTLYNCFVGVGSGVRDTTGNSNSGFGYSALAANTTGYNNTASGYSALAANTTGNNNTASGYSALAANTTGYNNTASGYSALAANTTGANNSGFGRAALAGNSTGNNNTASGYSALAANTTGSSNSGFGYSALAANTTGANNSGFGRAALAGNSTGSSNSGFGYFALTSLSSGSDNTAAGFQSGRYYSTGTDALTTANQCVFLGSTARASANGNTNEIVIGYNAVGAGSNTATLGNTSITKTVLRGNFGTLAAYGTSAAGVLGLASGTAPTTSPADAVQMWAADFNAAAGKAALHLRDESGVLSVFGNNWGLFTAGAEVIDATANKTIFLSNGTSPSAHTDDGIYIHSLDCGSYDSADDLASLALCTESAVITASKAQDSALAITINGQSYWMLLRACGVA